MNDVAFIEKIHQVYMRFREQAGKVIVGQSAVLEELFIALLAGGHCLLEGVPGLGKTLMVRTFAQALSLEFQRIQCTPDLMPGDITGSEMILAHNSEASGSQNLNFVQGPIFTNILLADEINRTPPRTQSALLEAMQEGQVTSGRVRHVLPRPFFVLATQNPIEQEGTYPLPEAQLDRFMFKSRVEYPDRAEEIGIIQRSGLTLEEIEPILSREEILEICALVRRVPAGEPVVEFACDVCRNSRPDNDFRNAEFGSWIREYVAWGAGPRAGLALLAGGRARAVLYGRLCVEKEDIRALIPSVLRHRIQTRFSADAAGISSDVISEKILEEVEKF